MSTFKTMGMIALVGLVLLISAFIMPKYVLAFIIIMGALSIFAVVAGYSWKMILAMLGFGTLIMFEWSAFVLFMEGIARFIRNEFWIGMVLVILIVGVPVIKNVFGQRG